MRISSRLLAFMLAAIGAVSVGLSSGSAHAASASVFVAPSGSDSGSCSHSRPCRSFGYAYRKAKPGEVVQVRGGSYGGQTIPVDGSKSSKRDVVIRPAPGRKVRLAWLEVHGSHLTVQRMRLTSSPYLRTWREASDVTIRRLHASRFAIMGSHNVRLDRRQLRACPQRVLEHLVGRGERHQGRNGHSPPRGEDPRLPPDRRVSSHVDCLHIFGARGVVIRRSLFYNCEVFAILFTKIPGSPVPTPTNVTIENNFIDCCGSGYFSIYLGDQHGERWSNFLVRNNSTNKPIGIGYDNTTVSRLRFLSNIAPSFQGCHRAGVSAHYNIWYHGSRCGRHDRIASSGFRAPGRHDFHLVRGAPGDRSRRPRVDPRQGLRRATPADGRTARRRRRRARVIPRSRAPRAVH